MREKERESSVRFWGEIHPAEGTSKCEGAEADVDSVHWQNSSEAPRITAWGNLGGDDVAEAGFSLSQVSFNLSDYCKEKVSV